MLSDRAFVLVKGKPENWKIDPFEKSGLYIPLVEILDKHGWHGKLFCPKPTAFNAKLAEPEEFQKEHHIDGHHILYGPLADGMMIPPGTTLRLTSGDCATIVVTHQKEDIVVAAHSGFKCLVDQDHVVEGKEGEERPSVVDSIMRRIKRYNPGIRLDGLEIEILASISGRNFLYPPWHKTMGENNRKILKYLRTKYRSWPAIVNEVTGGIDVPTIIKAEFARHNVPQKCITHDGGDTYEDPEHLWSNRRGDKERNLILIHHYR